MVTTITHRLAGAASVAAFGAVTALLVGLAFAQPAAAGDPCYHGFDIPARTEAAESEIKVGPCFFGPTVAHVPVDATVTFFNGEGFTHVITGANAEWGSRDVELKPESQVSYTFDKPGVYPYACALHRGMSGTIVVGDVASAGVPPATEAGTASGPGPGQAAAGATPTSLAGGATVLAGTASGVIAGAAALWLMTRRRGPRAGAAGID